MTAARDLITDDPYTTAVRLLQHAGLAEPATACRSLSRAGVEALADLTDTDQSAVQVVEELAGMDDEQLGSLLNMDSEREAWLFKRRLAFRAEGLHS